ncbi:MAG: hypothetical protein JW855_03260 [Gammaproteobacteria bacterium]|nr:hypothetical protein [Gammaproteobacteria bacterium]
MITYLEQFQCFQKTLKKFSKKFSFPINKLTEKLLVLSEKYANQLDGEINLYEKKNIQQQFKKSCLAVICNADRPKFFKNLFADNKRSNTNLASFLLELDQRFGVKSTYQHWFSNIPSLSSSNQQSPQEYTDCYVCDRLENFFMSQDGYSTLSYYFLSVFMLTNFLNHILSGRKITLTEKDLIKIENQFNDIRQTVKIRLTVDQLSRHLEWVRHNADVETQKLFYKKYQSYLDSFNAHFDEEGKPIYVVQNNHLIISAQVFAICSIPPKKPFILRWDRRFQYRIARKMTVFNMVYQAASKRLEKLDKDLAKLKTINPHAELLELMRDLDKECCFLEKQYQSQNVFPSKKLWFYPGSRKLVHVHQMSLLDTLYSHYQKISNIADSIADRFDQLKSDLGKQSCLKEMKKKYRDIKKYLMLYKGRADLYHEKFSKVLQNKQIHMRSMKESKKIEKTSSSAIIYEKLNIKEKSSKHTKKPETGSPKDKKMNLNELARHKLHALERLAGCHALEAAEFSLLCTFGQENMFQSVSFRNDLHLRLKKEYLKIIKNIKKKPEHFPDRETYLYQLSKYLQKVAAKYAQDFFAWLNSAEFSFIIKKIFHDHYQEICKKLEPVILDNSENADKNLETLMKLNSKKLKRINREIDKQKIKSVMEKMKMALVYKIASEKCRYAMDITPLKERNSCEDKGHILK